MKRMLLSLVVAAIGLSSTAGAQPIAVKDLPPELRNWVPWVLDEVPDHACPAVQGTAVCVWPGRLTLNLGDTGGTFTFGAYLDRPLVVPLPGDAQHWPLDVRLDGHPEAVFENGGGPAVRLEAGTNRLEGRFSWSRLPDSLGVPPRTALVDLRVGGKTLSNPRRDEAGLVWLRAEEGEAGAAESLRLQAFRRIADGIPLWAETRLSLDVAGKAREVEFPNVLLPHSIVVAVSGDLPARIDSAGKLRVQVRAGTFNVTILTRLEAGTAEVERPAAPEPWPDREVWVFAADERLRQVELSGLVPVDPSRTELPPEWKSLPAFLVEGGSRLALHEIRRGEPEAPPDKIQLHRELWLDLGGRGFTVRDHFTGGLSRTWRLDLQAPGELGRAALDRNDQLITSDPGTKRPGLEIRKGALNLEADSRLSRSSRLNAVGWNADVEQLEATLRVPPGWWLLAAPGADRVPGAWIARWTLLGFFFVLIVALATGRMYGRGWGVVALLGVILTYDEVGAPFLVWLSLLGASALLSVAPPGWLRTLTRIWSAGSIVALVLVLAPFLRDQVREALYPQAKAFGSFLEQGIGGAAPGVMHQVGSVAVPPPPPQAPAPVAKNAETENDEEKQEMEVPAEPAGEGAKAGSDRTEVYRLKAPSSIARHPSVRKPKAYGLAGQAIMNQALEQDPHAVLQTGPGVPNWEWQTYSLAWSGPVRCDQTVRLLLVSPFFNRVVIALRVLLVLLLALRLLIGGGGAAPVSPSPSGAVPAAAALFLLSFASGARADDSVPNAKILEQLKERLTRPQACQPSCISTSTLHASLQDGHLVFEAEVHAGDGGSWSIPGPASSWTPSEVRVDGPSSSALVRLVEDGFLHVRVSPGVHHVVAEGPAPGSDSFTLQLQDRPRRAAADAPGWEVSGLRADAPPDTSVQFNRRLRSGERARAESGAYAPWLEVRRTLTLGLKWTVRTEVHRVSPAGAPVSVKIPLLAGEAPEEADLETKDGLAQVSLGRDQEDTGWFSTLPISESISLTAGKGPWSEVWRLDCGVVWQCRAEGLPPVSHQTNGMLSPEFRPWPGESLSLKFDHPQAVAGATVTLDAVRVEAVPGERLTSSTLTLTARASREEPLVLTLPPGADVQEVTVNGAARPGKPDSGRLRVTLGAGSQAVVVRWREPRGIALFDRVPTVGLPMSAVNVEGVLHLPDNRWLLFVRGPAWGPAVLFWSYLVFALVVALGLGLFADTPLGILAWLLLALGLTQTSAVAALIVVSLFLVLSWRARNPLASPLLHNLLQVVLVVWVVAALVVLYGVVETGLLFRPDMQVVGAGSTNTLLRWYADRVDGATPAAGVLSVPLWIYRGLMLAWALWLATSLLGWASWAWKAAGVGGFRRPIRAPKPSTPPKDVSEPGEKPAKE